MPSGPAMTALIVMLDNLRRKLERCPGSFMPHEAEQLAWLLGERADRLPNLEDSIRYPDQQPGARQADHLIGRARTRPAGDPLPAEFTQIVEQRISTLRQQRELCEEPYHTDHSDRKRTASLLPDAATLDRLLRYETHAERSLHRSINTLAGLRGVPSESILAIFSRSPSDGHETLLLHAARRLSAGRAGHPWPSMGGAPSSHDFC